MRYSIQVTKDLCTHLFRNSKIEAIDRMTELMMSTKPEEVEEARAIYSKIFVANETRWNTHGNRWRRLIV